MNNTKYPTQLIWLNRRNDPSGPFDLVPLVDGEIGQAVGMVVESAWGWDANPIVHRKNSPLIRYRWATKEQAQAELWNYCQA